MSSTEASAQSEIEGEPESMRLVERVASLEGIDPIDLDPVLYDAIDPDALDSLFASRAADLSVEFTYHGYDVVVHADGRLDLDRRRD